MGLAFSSEASKSSKRDADNISRKDEIKENGEQAKICDDTTADDSEDKKNRDNKRGKKYNKKQKAIKKQKRERPERIFEPRPTIYDKDGKVIPQEERRPKKKVAMLLGYCGTGYHGMQLNPPARTIEGEIFQALINAEAVSKSNSTDLKKNAFMRAARTDKGVHAAGNVISMKLIIEDEDIVEKINSFLPDQIRIWGIERVNKSFDCRKMCSSRVYEYLLPTYALLPPRPTLILAGKIRNYNEEFPGVTRPDPEGEAWWKQTNEALLKKGITKEEIDKAQLAIRDNEDDESSSNSKFIKHFKKVENEIRRSYRVSEDRLKLFQEVLNVYVGHHNFHNFTIGKDFKDQSANRYILSTKVSKPFVIENTEWVSIKIHGQSFMLHQIRKMIGMASLVVRTGCPISRIEEAFQKTRINIPKAPALGLLLENPVYDGYNSKLEKFGYNPLSFEEYEERMLDFKKKFIYDKIYAEEVKMNEFHGFYGFIDNFNGDPIFDFLTAKGIEEIDPAKLDSLEDGK